MSEQEIEKKIKEMEDAGYGYGDLPANEYDSQLDALRKQLKKIRKSKPTMMYDPATGETKTMDEYQAELDSKPTDNNVLRYDTATTEEEKKQVLKDVDKAHKENGTETPEWIKEEIKEEEKPVEETKLTFEDFIAAVNAGEDPEEWLAKHPGYIPGDKTKSWLADYKAKKEMEAAENQVNQETPSDEPDKNEETVNKEEAKEVINNAKKDPSGWTKFWNAWKNGQFNMYPTMKAVADSIAKNAQMNADRANVLTGKGSDTSVYTPIETEQDKVREAQVETRAKTGTDMPTAFNEAENGNYEDLGRMIATGEITYEDAFKGLSGASKEKFAKWYENAERKDTAETKLTELTVEQANMQVKKDATLMVQNLQAEKNSLLQLKASLTGNDYEAFSNAVNAYKNAYGGIQSTGNAITETQNKSKNYQNTFNTATSGKGNIYMVRAEASLDETITNGGSSDEGKSNTLTSQQDTLLLNHLDEMIKAANGQMSKVNAANQQTIEQIDNRITEIDEQIADWKAVASSK